MHEAAPLRPGPHRRLDLDSERGQVGARAAPELVVTESRVEGRTARELGELARRDRAAAARLLPDLLDVHDLAGSRHPLDTRELDPLHVSDDRHPHRCAVSHAAPGYARRAMQDPMPLTHGVALPLDEVELRVSRSSGPGGQHANVTASRVEAVFDVAASPTLGEAQKARVMARLGPVVRAVAQDTRSQLRNRELALQRLQERLIAALQVPRSRRATKPTAASRRRRMTAKRRRSDVKRQRRRPSGDD